jgi:hypothetical protein
MFEERLMATAERCSALIVGIAGVAAGYLLLVSLSGWHPENSGFFSFSLPGWLHVCLTVSAVGAFVVCISTMLLAVTLETRRINAINESLARRRRCRLGANASRTERDETDEPQSISIRAHALSRANPESREAEWPGTEVKAPAGAEGGD